MVWNARASRHHSTQSSQKKPAEPNIAQRPHVYDESRNAASVENILKKMGEKRGEKKECLDPGGIPLQILDETNS